MINFYYKATDGLGCLSSRLAICSSTTLYLTKNKNNGLKDSESQIQMFGMGALSHDRHGLDV